MENIRLYYSTKHQNLGDAASPLVVGAVSGASASYEPSATADFFALGSILGKAVPDAPSFFGRLRGRFARPVTVWSSGFIHEPPATAAPIRPLRVLALRGELTRRALERVTGKSCNCPLGDGGLLLSRLIDPPDDRPFSIGIIPHYRELGNSLYRQLAERIPNAQLITVIGDVRATLAKIARCTAILSSSLHGLVAADSLGIPNLRIRHSGNVTGGEFKYRDYYSAFGMDEHPVLDLEQLLSAPPSPSDVAREYPIKKEMVEKLASALVAAWNG